MYIKEITEYSLDVLSALQILLPQLSKNAELPSEKQTQDIIESECSRLLFAMEDDHVLGMLTLIIFPIPTGVRAWIEDVVVDESGRGKGVGDALSQYAIKLARSEGAKTVDLTSRASRKAANRLYQRVGFISRDTNVYRYEINS